MIWSSTYKKIHMKIIIEAMVMAFELLVQLRDGRGGSWKD